MGNFDKNKAFSIGGGLAVLASIIAVAANLSEIAQFFKTDKPAKETSTPYIMETVEKTTEAEKAEEKVVEEVPPTVPQPSVVYLNSLKVTESSCFSENESNAEDTIGNTYIGNVMKIGTGYSDDCYATYYLGGKYKTLSGIIAVDERTDNDYSGQLSISADDNVIYTTDEMGRVSVPIEFSVNVENCQWLRINKFGRTYNGHGTWFILSDFRLE
ncbi:MAG: NPCBM/NEW2 domain-containing protein [Ruminococcus sp.]|nr:NPCBM/NEW2 domain-containing protein [Ruminococcus sp.]